MRRKYVMERVRDEELERFIDKLGASLVQGFSEDQLLKKDVLNDSLHHSMSSLPECGIRKKLEDSYEECLTELQRYILKHFSTHFSASDWKFNLATNAGLEEALLDIQRRESYKEKLAMYFKLVTCSSLGGPVELDLVKIFEHWSESLESCAPRDLVETVRISSRLMLLNSSSSTLLMSGMSFILQSLESFVKKTKDLPKPELLLNSMKSVVLRLITYLHYNGNAIRCHGDSLAGIVMEYVKLCMRMKEVPLEQLTSVLLIVLGHSPRLCFMPFLDTDIPLPSNCPPFYSLLQSVFRYTLATFRLLLQQEPFLYICASCCVILLAQAGNLCSVKKQYLSLVPPLTLNQWLWRHAPILCEQLKIQKGWSANHLGRFLIDTVSPDQVKPLLSLVKGSELQFSSVSELNKPVDHISNVELFYVDSQGDFNYQKVVDEENVAASQEDDDKEKLQEMASPKGQDALDEYVSVESPTSSFEITPLITRKRSKETIIPISVTKSTPGAKDEELTLPSNAKKRKKVTQSVESDTTLAKTVPVKRTKRSSIATPKAEARVSPKLLRSTAKKKGITLDRMGRFV